MLHDQETQRTKVKPAEKPTLVRRTMVTRAASVWDHQRLPYNLSAGRQQWFACLPQSRRFFLHTYCTAVPDGRPAL